MQFERLSILLIEIAHSIQVWPLRFDRDLESLNPHRLTEDGLHFFRRESFTHFFQNDTLLVYDIHILIRDARSTRGQSEEKNGMSGSKSHVAHDETQNANAFACSQGNL